MFLIQFDNSPDFERFGYFVNYLVYPIDFLEFKAEVRGYYRTKDVISFPELKKGNWLMFYINHKDQEPDNVYITDGANYSYSIDFGGNLKKLDDTVKYFEKFSFDLDDFNHIIDIYPDPSEELIQTKPWWKFW
ncbi:hypothetical protein [uncultured Aquimarina sp.]|uniref:hypothetical protein n=1 Tax=uncultured Aquimarina sp. TaxID=575652 RepID=UPI00260317D3|nr:hypothetical protein [uncultured Aquimarina sp.]